MRVTDRSLMELCTCAFTWELAVAAPISHGPASRKEQSRNLKSATMDMELKRYCHVSLSRRNQGSMNTTDHS